jgi:hypothetical protein
MQIFVPPSKGTPPFYMNMIALGGTPETTMIGTDVNDLFWTLDQQTAGELELTCKVFLLTCLLTSGTQLLLQVLDSKGTSGGVASLKYNVISECLTVSDSRISRMLPTKQ